MNAPHTRHRISNALTIDVEDYFQVSAFAPHIDRSAWDRFRRVSAISIECSNCWIETTPGQRSSRSAAGGALPAHRARHRRERARDREPWQAHLPRLRQSRADFADDIAARNGCWRMWPGSRFAVIAHRASRSAAATSGRSIASRAGLLQFERLPGAARPLWHAGRAAFPFRVRERSARDSGHDDARVRRNLPAGGGGYFRLAPYQVSRWAIGRVNRVDRRPAIFYFHPWEIDPRQPRVDGISAKTRFRHYLNLDRTEPRLQQLMRDFHWDRVDRVFDLDAA
jgi:hypothetical protein